MRCADRRRRDHRLAGRRAPDAQGLDVIIVDREWPGRGSTAASTSMLLWEIDRPLTQLTEAYGFERAARAYRASLDAVAGLKSLVLQLGIACDMRDKNSLYLAAGDTQRRTARGASLARSAPACPAIFSTMRVLLELRHRARRRDRLAGRGRCRSDATGARAAQRGHGARRPAVRRRGGGSSTRRRARSASVWPMAARSRRARSCSRPAMSCPISFIPPCKRCRRAGRSRPRRSRKTSGRMPR